MNNSNNSNNSNRIFHVPHSTERAMQELQRHTDSNSHMYVEIAALDSPYTTLRCVFLPDGGIDGIPCIRLERHTVTTAHLIGHFRIEDAGFILGMLRSS